MNEARSRAERICTPSGTDHSAWNGDSNKAMVQKAVGPNMSSHQFKVPAWQDLREASINCKNWGPQKRPKYVMILITGTPTKGPPVLGIRPLTIPVRQGLNGMRLQGQVRQARM